MNKGSMSVSRAAVLEGLLHTCSSGIIAIDRQTNIILFNEAAERLTQLPRGDAMSRPIQSVIPDVSLPSVHLSSGER
ncbi:PAS domain-containing protein [Brevibacillus massiliensis]|uniref:PAS domain-containing protein n=1 Tax=Brevibacillus massiliensis TaxID=1118054 RepID=UPI0002EE02F3|nr:PAS domain-containing protein [Brevibacillus massiliensis]